MKKITAIITTLSITLSLFIFPVSATAATAVDITISVNEIRQIRVTPKEGFATKWRTSDRNVVIVSKTGKIKGIAEGKAAVTATAGKSTLKFNIIVKKAEEPVLLPDAPEIVFLLISYPYVNHKEKKGTLKGLFIDNNGNINEFSLIVGEYNISDKNEKIMDFIIKNYEALIKAGENTGKSVTKSKLEEYYNMFKKVDKNRQIIHYPRNGADVEHGFAHYYGIGKRPSGELEIILFKGRGDIKYDNHDPFAEKISQWLIKTIPFKLYRNLIVNGVSNAGFFDVDYENWHESHL